MQSRSNSAEKCPKFPTIFETLKIKSPTMVMCEHFTGATVDRPVFRRLIEAGKLDCVVIYKVDRLNRSLLDFTRIMLPRSSK